MLTGFLLAAVSALSVAAVDIYAPPSDLKPCTGLVWRTDRFARLDGGKIVVEVPKGEARTGVYASAPIDLAPFAGKGVEAEIVVSGCAVSEPFHGYNGVKFQVFYTDPKTGNRVYRDVVERPRGTFADTRIHLRFALGADVPRDARLRLGLSESSGAVTFDLGSLRIGEGGEMFRKINGDFRVRYPDVILSRRRRGVMSPSRDMTEDDFRTLRSWGVNLLRYQMTRGWSKFNDNQDLAEYDRWQDGRLNHLDRFVLPMAEKYGIDVVIDLHVFPGGRDATKESNVLHDRRFAEHFLERWRVIATRFRGRRNVYGYDLVNELNQRRRSNVTDYWNLQREAAEIVRAIDPVTPIIVGANLMENPSAFEYLSPLRMDNVIYQVHMYEPGAFTHYRVHSEEQKAKPDPTIAYPSVRGDGRWDKDYLRAALEPVRRFQLRHGARIYAGEFSAAAWTKGADRYLADCISLFEEYGWDWSYHAFREWPGWNVECEGPDRDHLVPSVDNPRKRALLNGFGMNADPARWLSVPSAPTVDAAKAARLHRAADGTSWFATTVTNVAEVSSAKWTTAGLGVYEIYVNGARVGTDFLKPGFTHFAKTKYSFSYDVTSLLKRGAGEANVLVAEVSSGWWRDKIVNFAGRKSAFRGTLEVTYADGSRRSYGTDPETWRCGIAGPVTHAGIYDGEEYDARIAAPRTGEGLAERPEVNAEFQGEILPARDVTVCLRRDLAMKRGPFDIRKGETRIVDFGQNCAAVPEFRFRAKAGTVLTALPGEMLNDANRGVRGCDGPKGSVFRANLRTPNEGMRVVYTFAGRGTETYLPRFTFFGYRYLSITATDDVTIDSVASIPVSSITKEMETGTLETGDRDVNRLVQNIIWSQRSNYLSVPTDCPQRSERFGWAADTQVFAEAGSFNADTYGVLSKWMRDLRDSQHPLGGFPGVAPVSQYGNNCSRIGWSDAGVAVPHVMWRQFGNRRIVDENWAAMERFVDRIAAAKYRTELLPEAGDYQWADWLSRTRYEGRPYKPELSGFEKVVGADGRKSERPKSETRLWWDYLGGCHWLWDAERMAEMARGTGRDAAKYERMSAAARAYLKETFFATPDGTIREPFRDMQTAALFALRLGLVEGDAAERTRQLLRDGIAARGGTLETGFLGTAIALDTLTEQGMSAVAYDLLLNHRFPGWLYSVDQGATTIWERWDCYTKEKGFGPAALISFNHYAAGSVLAWIYKTAAGIAADPKAPGFRNVIMRPIPDRRLGFVKAAYRSAAGLITSHWRYEGEKWIWEFTIPDGATASVTLPGETASVSYGPGSYSLSL